MSAKPQSVLAQLAHTRIGVTSYLTPRTSLASKQSIADLTCALDECVEARETYIVLDLASVQMINSLALETLLDYQDRLVKIGGWLKASNVNTLVRDVFRLTGFDEYIIIMDSEEEIESQDSAVVTVVGQHKLGDILVEMGFVSEENIERAMRLQDKRGDRLGRILVEQGWVSKHNLLAALGKQLSLPFVRLRPGVYDPDIVGLLDYKTACRLTVLPLFRVRGVVYLATTNPQTIPSLDEVEERVGYSVQPVLALPDDIHAILNENPSNAAIGSEIFGDVDEDFQVLENVILDDYTEIDQMAAGSPVINLVNAIIQRAVRDGASDIHIEPFRAIARIRYRIDGVLYEFKSPKIELHPSIVSRLKVMANLDISERRLPQDGRIQVQTHGRSVDLRFSSLPGLFGEKVVLRVLDKNQTILDVEKLGMSDDNLETFRSLLKYNYGLILVTGPTGSGKTTSLYAALNFLKTIEKNIVTIEDPVEYQIDIINQNEVKPQINLTFSKILKHVLRQDPDIIMVGEIRERETAEIAVQAALTGHLVLSTLHTNDSIGAVTRLIDMGVEPYLLSSALIGVVAQRLVRTICPSCKSSFAAPADVIKRYGWKKSDRIKLYRGRGCAECYDSGYKGRIGIHETLNTTPDLQRLVMSNPRRDQLQDYMEKHGNSSLFQDGLDRVRTGQTTIEEVARAITI